MENEESLELDLRRQRLKLSYQIGWVACILVITWSCSSPNTASMATTSSSLSSSGIVHASVWTFRLRFASSHEKKLVICFGVRNSALVASCISSCYHRPRDLNCICIFCPLVSATKNLFTKYSFCLSINLALLVWANFRAHPICKYGCRVETFVTVASSPNCGTLVNWLSSLAAYPRTALSSMVSLSNVGTCLPQSKCLWRDENLSYDVVHPSAGHAKS